MDNKCKLEIQELNKLNNNINNIDKINIIGDIHGDINILLDYLKKQNILDYNYEYYKRLNRYNKYYYFIYDNTYQTYLLKIYNDKINENDKFNYDIPLILNENTYNNLNDYILLNDEDDEQTENDNNYIIVIKFNKEYINKLKNIAFIFLGDIADTHYVIDTLSIDYDKLYKKNRFKCKYNNDVGCYHILFILKKLFDTELLLNNNKIILLYGNHELYASLYDLSNKKIYNNLTDGYLLSVFHYLITPFELSKLCYREYEKLELYIDDVYVYFDKYNKYFIEKYNKRRNYLLYNYSKFNFIISINTTILLSHNLLYQNILLKMYDVLKKNNIINDNNNNSLIQVLESIFKYLLHKNKYSYKYDDCLNQNYYKQFMNLLIKLSEDRVYDDNKENPFILCNIDNFNNIDKFNEKYCNNNIHIIGHIPQYYKNNLRNNFINYDDINNVLPNNGNYKPIYLSNDNVNNINSKQNNQFDLTEYFKNYKAYNYTNYYIYFLDYHLSNSFYDAFDENKKYYLEIDYNNHLRKLIPF